VGRDTPDEGGRVGEDLLGVVDADGLVEPCAAGGVRRRVRRVERDGAGRRRGRGQGQEGSDRGDVKLHLVLQVGWCCELLAELGIATYGRGGVMLGIGLLKQ